MIKVYGLLLFYAVLTMVLSIALGIILANIITIVDDYHEAKKRIRSRDLKWKEFLKEKGGAYHDNQMERLFKVLLKT